MKSSILNTVLIFICSLISISDGQLLGIIPTPNPTAILNSAQLIVEATALKASVTSIDPNVNLTSLPSSIVSLPGGFTLDLAQLYWPIQQLCPRTGIIGKLACMFCSNDCTFVHNKFGGTCGTTGETNVAGICLCNDNQSDGNGPSFTDVIANCGSITTDPATDNQIDLASKILFRDGTSQYQRCLPSALNPNPDSVSPGCDADCKLVHGYKSGRCVQDETAVATYPNESSVGFYCGCFN